MIRNTTRAQYESDYRFARVMWRRYRNVMHCGNVYHPEALESWTAAFSPLLKPTDRIEEFSEMMHDDKLRPLLLTGMFRVRKSDYPSPTRFETVIMVKSEPEPLVQSGMIYRAFERLDGGTLQPLYVSAETLDGLKERIRSARPGKSYVFITA